MPKKILIIVNSTDSISYNQRWQHLINNLAEYSIHISVVYYGGKNDVDSYDNINSNINRVYISQPKIFKNSQINDSKLKSRSIKIISTYYSNRLSKQNIISLLKTTRFDYFISTGPLFYFHKMCGRISKDYNINWIADISSIPSASQIQKAESYVFNNSDYLLFSDPIFLEHFSKFYFIKSKSFIIGNGFDPTFFTETKKIIQIEKIFNILFILQTSDELIIKRVSEKIIELAKRYNKYSLSVYAFNFTSNKNDKIDLYFNKKDVFNVTKNLKFDKVTFLDLMQNSNLIIKVNSKEYNRSFFYDSINLEIMYSGQKHFFIEENNREAHKNSIFFELSNLDQAIHYVNDQINDFFNAEKIIIDNKLNKDIREYSQLKNAQRLKNLLLKLNKQPTRNIQVVRLSNYK